MSEIVPVRLDTSQAGLAKIKEQFAPKATDQDLVYFGQVATHLALDPWAGHIVLTPWWEDGKQIHRPLLTVAGRRFIAQRTGHLRGIVGPAWCGVRQFSEDGKKIPLDWMELWDEDDDYPYAARCFVYRNDWDHPANGTVKWSEFSQTYNAGSRDRPDWRLKPTWAAMPSHMLGKVAESLALRRAFSEVEGAVAYMGGTDDDDWMVREAEADESAASQSSSVEAGSPARSPLPPSGEVSTPRRGSRRDDDRVPDWVYDDLPEARGSR